MVLVAKRKHNDEHSLKRSERRKRLLSLLSYNQLETVWREHRDSTFASSREVSLRTIFGRVASYECSRFYFSQQMMMNLLERRVPAFGMSHLE